MGEGLVLTSHRNGLQDQLLVRSALPHVPLLATQRNSQHLDSPDRSPVLRGPRPLPGRHEVRMAGRDPLQSALLPPRVLRTAGRPRLAALRPRRRRNNHAGRVDVPPHVPVLLSPALRYRAEVRLLRHRSHDRGVVYAPVLLRLYLPGGGYVAVHLDRVGVPVLRVCSGHGARSLAQGAQVAQCGSLAPGSLFVLPWHNPLGPVPLDAPHALRFPNVALVRRRHFLLGGCDPVRNRLPRTLLQEDFRHLRAKPQSVPRGHPNRCCCQLLRVVGLLLERSGV